MFVLVFETHSGKAHQKLSYEGSFLLENALAWFSSGALTAYFLSAFSIGISLSFLLFIYLVSQSVSQSDSQSVR